MMSEGRRVKGNKHNATRGQHNVAHGQIMRPMRDNMWPVGDIFSCSRAEVAY